MEQQTENSLEHAITGSLLGTAIGDALGLPYEGLSRRRAKKLLGEPDRHRFLFRRGMVSDDTEHSCMVAQALIERGDDPEGFQTSLARRLRYWLLALPAGTGLATLKSIVKLWLGFSPERSGVFSAGNGPAMRSAILGAAIDDANELAALVRVSTQITHTDPKAEYGAFAVALAAQMARKTERVAPKNYLEELNTSLPDGSQELLTLIEKTVSAVQHGKSTEAFAESLGLSQKVTGYVYHTVPVCIHAWLTHQEDFRGAISSVIRCGGDADTTAAIVGGIVGSSVGKEGIPAEWLDRLADWPRTVSWMERLAKQLAETGLKNEPQRPLRLTWFGTLVRNLFFLVVVLFHGFRRLFPPY